MTDSAKFAFTGAVAQAYEQFFVTRLFEPWARVLLDALDVRPGEALLDVACGPGSVARLAARRVGADGRVTGCDISADMLAVARAKSPEPGAAPIEYVQSPAAPLPFADARFDAITCQQGLQFFPDKVAALSEMRRVLRPGGRAGLVVFRPPDGAAFFIALQAAAMRAAAEDFAAGMSGVLRYGTPDEVRRDLTAAGFTDVVLEERTVAVVFEDGLDQAVASIRATPFWPPVAAKGAEAVAGMEREARIELARYVVDGAVRVEQRSVVAVATR